MLTLFSGDSGPRDTFRFIEEVLSAGIWSWNLDTNAMEWSSGVYRLFGLQPGTVTPHFDIFQDMVHPDDRLPAAEVRRAYAGMLRRLYSEFRIVWRNGRVRWVENKGETLIGPDGNASRAVGIMRDVTDQRETLRRLQVSDARLQALTVAVGAPVWTVNSDGSAIAVDNWNELRAHPADTAQGNAWMNLVHPDDRAATQAAWDKARVSNARFEVEHRVLQPDGSYRWQLMRAMPVKMPGEKVEDEYVGVSFDIHHAKELPPMTDAERRLTGAQIRAARGILRWSVRDLAERAKVSSATVRRLEESDGAVDDDEIGAICRTLRHAGVEFFAAEIGKPGVSIR